MAISMTYDIVEFDSATCNKKIVYKQLSKKDLEKTLRKKYAKRYDENGVDYIEIVSDQKVLEKIYIT